MMDKVFYELVLIVRPDVPVMQLPSIVESISSVLSAKKGSIEGVEYWGFRTLAYRIEKRSKAHYVFLGLALETETVEKLVEELNYCLKFHLRQEIARHLLLKVAQLHLPTPLFHSSLAEAVSGAASYNKALEECENMMDEETDDESVSKEVAQ